MKLNTPSTVQASVLIPALNEAKRIAQVVAYARADPATGEVIVIDDSSIDATAALARNAGATCRDCGEAHAFEPGGVSDADETEVVGLVRRDVQNTIGARHTAVVDTVAARVRLFTVGREDFEQRVVDDVQQELHDGFIDTSWPRCPAHPHHPLQYSRRGWVCLATGRVVAQLGTLVYTADHHAG